MPALPGYLFPHLRHIQRNPGNVPGQPARLAFRLGGQVDDGAVFFHEGGAVFQQVGVAGAAGGGARSEVMRSCGLRAMAREPTELYLIIAQKPVG